MRSRPGTASGDAGPVRRDVGIGLAGGDLPEPLHRVEHRSKTCIEGNGPEPHAVWRPVIADDAVADQRLAELPGVVMAEADVATPARRGAGRGEREPERRQPFVRQRDQVAGQPDALLPARADAGLPAQARASRTKLPMPS